jgi:hypothetical protein
MSVITREPQVFVATLEYDNTNIRNIRTHICASSDMVRM